LRTPDMTAVPTPAVAFAAVTPAVEEPARSRPVPAAGRRRRRTLTWVKWGVGVAAVLPAARLGWLLAHDGLGANPVAEAMNRLGWWTLILLLASLALTPIKILTGWAWPIALRRLVGLLALAYAGLHFSWYLGVDQFFDFREIYSDIVKRKFITVGFGALGLLIPLGVTSTAGMVKRLGARRWKRLHRLVYVAAGLGVIHFIWRVKSDVREPLVFAGALFILLAIRVVSYFARRGRKIAPGPR
jgi:sulfoxide reductase heme-binding subunit YedZ